MRRCTRFGSRNSRGQCKMDSKSFLIGALIAVLIAGGYFYYETTRDQVKIDSDGVKIQVN